MITSWNTPSRTWSKWVKLLNGEEQRKWRKSVGKNSSEQRVPKEPIELDEELLRVNE
jgi:hypothetical protein